jgi:hypothetical protein
VRLRVLDIHDLGIPEDDSEIVGTVISARALAEHNFLALEIVTSRGITYPCQMWDNDPQYVALGPVVDQLVDHKVKATILGCSAGKRTMKDGSTKL